MNPQELPMAPPSQQPPLAITEEALAKVLEFRASVPEPEKQAMWVEVTGIAGGDWTYNMSLKPLELARPGDSLQQNGELAVVVPAADIPRVKGGAIDRSDDGAQGGRGRLTPRTPSAALA